jgi:hypothetical protein
MRLYPCMPVSSGAIGLGRIAAGRRDIDVWLRRASSAVDWGRSHLVCHWLQAVLPSSEGHELRVPADAY